STSLTPPLRILAAYAVFFAFGWFAYKCADRLEAFARHGWWNFSLGMVGSFFFFAALDDSRGRPSTMVAFSAGLTVWFIAYGLIGLYLRYANGANPTVRYLADASYWIYLIHMPLTILLSATLADASFNAF